MKGEDTKKKKKINNENKEGSKEMHRTAWEKQPFKLARRISRILRIRDWRENYIIWLTFTPSVSRPKCSCEVLKVCGVLLLLFLRSCYVSGGGQGLSKVILQHTALQLRLNPLLWRFPSPNSLKGIGYVFQCDCES